MSKKLFCEICQTTFTILTSVISEFIGPIGIPILGVPVGNDYYPRSNRSNIITIITNL